VTDIIVSSYINVAFHEAPDSLTRDPQICQVSHCLQPQFPPWKKSSISCKSRPVLLLRL